MIHEGKYTVKWCVNTSRSPAQLRPQQYHSLHQVPLSLPPFLPAGIIVLLSACYGLISLVAIFGNCLVIFVVWATRSMRNVTNFYIANLASADVFIAVFCIPFQGT